MDLARAPRRARLTARKKGSGYENVHGSVQVSRWENATGIKWTTCYQFTPPD
jgi:hypothetical protein